MAAHVGLDAADHFRMWMGRKVCGQENRIQIPPTKIGASAQNEPPQTQAFCWNGWRLLRWAIIDRPG